MIAATILTLALIGPPSVPDAIVAAIAAKETGSVWDGHLVRRVLPDNGSDVSAWQLSRAVLYDLRASPSRARTDPAYAEALTRRWLSHLFSICRSWPLALRAYHCGLRATDTPAARQYADDVLNLAALYHPTF